MTQQTKLDRYFNLSIETKQVTRSPNLSAEKTVDENGDEQFVLVPENEEFGNWENEWVEMYDLLKDQWGTVKGYPHAPSFVKKEGHGGELSSMTLLVDDDILSDSSLFD